MLLERQTFLDTDDQEKARELIFARFGASRFEVFGSAGSFRINSSCVRVKSVSLLRSASNAEIETGFCESDFIRQYFVLSGSSRISVGVGAGLYLSPRVSGIVDPGRKISVRTSTNLDHMILRIEQAALKRKLASLLNVHVDRVPVFGGVLDVEDEMTRRMREAVAAFAFDTDNFGVLGSDIVKTELEQSLITKFLMFSSHEYSDKLRAPALSMSSSQLHLIEEYIEANWNKPLDIETLAKISNVSARSIFRHFRRARNCSPLDFVKRVRLDRVRSVLVSGAQDLSVMRVALSCGFQSFGHFAADYRSAFGELPSSTLRRARGD